GRTRRCRRRSRGTSWPGASRSKTFGWRTCRSACASSAICGSPFSARAAASISIGCRSSLLVVDRRSPARDLAVRHGAVRLQASIPVSPLVDVEQVLLARQDRPLTDAVARRRVLDLRVEAAHELAQHAGRYALAFAWINEAEEHEVAQQDAPVTTEAREEPRPVEALDLRPEQVRDVGAVEALALHDERLG